MSSFNVPHSRTWVWVLAILLVLLFPMVLGAAPSNLPPRPTDSPVVPPTVEPRPRGGWIELRVQNAANQWTVVQWQDPIGVWNDIDSWRGAFDQVENGIGRKKWWVDQTLFGAGPFRWTVYELSSRQVVAQSTVFVMPQEAQQTVVVEVALAP